MRETPEQGEEESVVGTDIAPEPGSTLPEEEQEESEENK